MRSPVNSPNPYSADRPLIRSDRHGVCPYIRSPRKLPQSLFGLSAEYVGTDPVSVRICIRPQYLPRVCPHLYPISNVCHVSVPTRANSLNHPQKIIWSITNVPGAYRYRPDCVCGECVVSAYRALLEFLSEDDINKGLNQNFCIEEPRAVLQIVKVEFEAAQHFLHRVGVAVVECGV